MNRYGSKSFLKPVFENQIAKWLDYADHQLASLRRSSSGLIAAIIRWLVYGDHRMAL